MWDALGGGGPVDPIYKAINSLGMASALPPNHTVSRREAMQELWEKTGLESIDTRVIRIPIVYSDFDEFWDSNSVAIGPQGKLINGMSPQMRSYSARGYATTYRSASDGNASSTKHSQTP